MSETVAGAVYADLPVPKRVRFDKNSETGDLEMNLVTDYERLVFNQQEKKHVFVDYVKPGLEKRDQGVQLLRIGENNKQVLDEIFICIVKLKILQSIDLINLSPIQVHRKILHLHSQLFHSGMKGILFFLPMKFRYCHIYVLHL